MVAKVPTTVPAIIEANRLTKAASAGPATICQMFVISVGITKMAAASAGGIATERTPMASVGKPMPMTPFTSPASKNVPVTTATRSAVSDMRSGQIKRRAAKTALHAKRRRPRYTISRCSIPLVRSLSFAILLLSLMFRRTSLVESAKRRASS